MDIEAIRKHNSSVEHEWRILAQGERVSGHTVIMCTKLRDRVVGDSYASWIALLETNNPDSYHRWVTWNVVAVPDGWLAEGGNYFRGKFMDEALADYHARGGKE